MKIELTARNIDKLEIKGKRYDVRFIGQALNGLILRVGKTGTKTWAFWKSIPNSKDVYFKTYGKAELDAHKKVKPENIDAVIEWTAQQRRLIFKGKNKIRASRLSNKPETMHALYDMFMENHSKTKNRLATQENNKQLWKNHIEPEYRNVRVEDVSHADVDSFISRKIIELQKRGGSGGRANNILALLSSMFNFAIKRQYISHNPCYGIRKLKTEHDWPSMDDDERQRLRLAACSESRLMGLIVDMALKTGARKQEILKARWEHIEGNKWRIPKKTSKGKEERVLTLPPILSKDLNDWRMRKGIVDSSGNFASIARPRGYLFPSESQSFNGKFNKITNKRTGVTPEVERPQLKDIKSAFTRVRSTAGLEHIRFHDLRHDFGTQSARAGMTIYDIMEAMGHSSIDTTMIYIKKAGLEGQEKVLRDREARIETQSQNKNTNITKI